MPYRPDIPESHRRPKPEDRPPWPSEPHQQLQWFQKVFRRDVATLSASTLSLLLTYPLDTLKTNMQTDMKYIKSSNIAGKGRFYNAPTVQCYLDMSKRGGIREFYRGIGPPLITVSGYRWLNMWAYRRAKWQVDVWTYDWTGSSPLAQVNTLGSRPTGPIVFTFATSGAFAGFVGSFYTSPLELVKYAQQLSQKISTEPTGDNISAADKALRQSYKGAKSLSSVSKIIYRNFGLKGFYLGFRYHAIRDTVGGAFYFGVYEAVKQLMGPYRGKDAADPFSVMLAGGLCGAASSAVLFPYDTAKSRYQKNCLSHVNPQPFPAYSWVKNIRANYPGFGITLARASFTHGLFFVVYELIKRHIESEEYSFEDVHK